MGIVRAGLRSAAVLIALFALLLGVILVHPRDNRAIRGFFSAPEGCAAPCFLGIRLGVTTSEQVVAILSAQAWVGKLTVRPGSLSWTWNGSQPAFVGSALDVGRVTFSRDDRASTISLSTRTNWGSFRTIFGAPDQEYYAAREFSSGFYPYLLHGAEYAAQGFEIVTDTPCPFRSRADLWYSTITIVMPINPFDELIRIRSC